MLPTLPTMSSMPTEPMGECAHTSITLRPTLTFAIRNTTDQSTPVRIAYCRVLAVANLWGKALGEIDKSSKYETLSVGNVNDIPRLLWSVIDLRMRDNMIIAEANSRLACAVLCNEMATVDPSNRVRYAIARSDTLNIMEPAR